MWKDFEDLATIMCRCESSLFVAKDSPPRTNAHPLNPNCCYTTNSKHHHTYTYANSVTIPSVQSIFAISVHQKMRIKRLARTDNGYLGLVTNSTRIGDNDLVARGRDRTDDPTTSQRR
jgi:hypothetical protein